MATLRFDNPFHDLWVTEILDPWAYVRMFSPILVSDTEELFSRGHVVLKGRQGSGKSMLLNLLETSTRVAYAHSQTKYPVPLKQRQFISAGVQLSRENSSLVAARSAELPENQRANIVAANFADYLNSLLCLDLLKNVSYLAQEQAKDHKILEEVPVNLTGECQLSLFAALFKGEGWSGFVDEKCATIDRAIECLEDRLRAHKNYFNLNIDKLPDEIETSRSTAGVPMAELASALRESGILPIETLVLLRIDQHEELFELERHTGLGHVFRQVINSALARRDPRVAYRIGTRHYAWKADLTAWGSGAPLEELRDYSVVDLDAILRRGEHTKKWKFPTLAKDVLRKRLEGAGFKVDGNDMEVLFGRSMEPADRARRYIGGSKSLVRAESSWAPEWKSYLDSLWNGGDPLEARFGEAWLRQAIQKRRRIAQNGMQATGLPWRKSPWWVKERNEIALMQLAGERQQALVWSGERQIIDLAGHNILAFMTICKTVWATWQRRNPGDADKRSALPRFSVDDQVIGITEASQIWFKKIQVGLEADQRTRLVTVLGGWFRRRMLEDQALSYPGHSGFSLLQSDISAEDFIVSIIKSCRDHGDLLESAHTTKHRDQAPRLKWYLHPLLCPLFRIPHIRTKEPIYSSPQEIQLLYANQKRQSTSFRESSSFKDDTQLGLPGI
ncbi:hypothetical protein [Paraburkholderia sp. BCC1886]|uniref:ORC-CDC6 family AAA ATPase n=1 Tax=Paraburkholderia sp. BCC1886 TaxID=2562670 RepID=UPI0011839EDE|nr:hypothetical protein [Paraburkholderia sp. BCC1886]